VRRLCRWWGLAGAGDGIAATPYRGGRMPTVGGSRGRRRRKSVRVQGAASGVAGAHARAGGSPGRPSRRAS
jgi:hypothetical protein